MTALEMVRECDSRAHSTDDAALYQYYHYALGRCDVSCDE